MDKRLNNTKSDKKVVCFRWIYFVLSLLSLFLNSCFFVPEQPIEDNFHPGIIVTAAASNNSPSISSISNISSDMGSRITGISFTVDESDNVSSEEDDQTLTVTASSSNQSLIPDANITVNYTDNGAGDASNVAASIDLFPLVSQVGSSTIMITVTDNSGGQTTKSFSVTVSNPLNTISGQVLWLKADAEAYKTAANTTLATNGDNVLRWYDQSGAGIVNYVEALGGAGTEPTWRSSVPAFNGRPGILFDDTAFQYLEINTAILAGAPFTGYVVASPDDNTIPGVAFSLADKDTFNQSFVAVFTSPPNNFRLQLQNGAVTRLVETPYTFAGSNGYIGSFIEASSTERFVQVNSSGSKIDTNLASPVAMDRTSVGRAGDSTPSSYFSGHIAEIIIYNRVLSISEQQKINAYLGVKYGIQTIPSDNQKLWLKADKGVTSDACAGTSATNGQTVACWDDQSGNNNDAATIIGAPTFTASTTSTPNYVSLNGSSHLVVGAAATWAFLNSGHTHTEFLVFKTTSTNPATTFSLLDTKAGATDNLGFNLSYDDTSNDAISILIAEGATTTTVSHNTADGAVTAGAWNIVTHELTTASTSHLITTGSLASSVSTGSAFNSASPAGALALGAEATAGTNSLIGDIGEVIIYDASLTHTDRQRTEMYLSEKFNITYPSHPVLNQPGLKLWLKADSGVNTTRTNWLNRSEEWDHADWGDNGLVRTANQANGPDGSVNTADQITGGPNGTCSNLPVIPDGTSEKIFTCSFWVRAVVGTANFRMMSNHGAVATQYSNVRTVGTTWERVSHTVTNGVGAGNGRQNCGILGDTVNPYDVYVWGAQLEQYPKMTAYIPTVATNASVSGGPGFVSSWSDQSPFGNSATQATAVNQPLWNSNGTGKNRPAIHCDGVNDMLVTPRMTSAFTQGYTLFLVHKTDDGDPATAVTPFGSINSVGTTDSYFYLYHNSGGNILYRVYENGVAASLTLSNLANGPSNLMIISVVADPAGNLEGWFNGASSGTADLTVLTWANIAKANTENVGVCARTNDSGAAPGNPFQGDIAESIIYGGPLNQNQREKIECYLSSKYNIAVSHACPI